MTQTPNPKAADIKIQWAVLLVSLILGVMGTILLKNYMTKSLLVLSGGELQTILFAKQDLAAGIPIVPGMLESREVPAAYMSFRSISAAQESFVVGQKTVVQVGKGQAMLWTHFDLADRPDLSRKLGINERAITIRVDQRSGLDGLLQVGDRVDVICTLELPSQDLGQRHSVTRPILQNITVLAINGSMKNAESVGEDDASSKKPQSAVDAAKSLQLGQIGATVSTVTLRVSVDEALVLSFAESKGDLRLVARSQEDVFVENQSQVSFESILSDSAAETKVPNVVDGAYPMIYEEGVKKGSGYWGLPQKDGRAADLLKIQSSIIASELREVNSKSPSTVDKPVSAP